MSNLKLAREVIEEAAKAVGGCVEVMAKHLCVKVPALIEAIEQEHMSGMYRSLGTWGECRGEQAHQQLLADTLTLTGGNRSHAATLLKMSRQHLQRVLCKYANQVHDTVASSDSSDTVAPVAPTVLPALTYWLPGPSFHRVQTVEAVETATMTFELPKHLKDRLERKALDRKQSNGGRFSVSPVIVEILERAFAEEGQ